MNTQQISNVKCNTNLQVVVDVIMLEKDFSSKEEVWIKITKIYNYNNKGQLFWRSSNWWRTFQMIHLQVERNFLLMSIAYAANIGTNFAWIFEYMLVQMFVLANIGGNIVQMLLWCWISTADTISQVGLVLSLDPPLTWLYLKFSTRWFDWLVIWLYWLIVWRLIDWLIDG